MAADDKPRPIYPSAVPSGRGNGGGRPRSPVDQWFEVFVYAPLGFALDARQLFPRFVDRGRNQVVLAKVIGKYAVEHGSKQVNEYLGQSQNQVAAVLQALGVLPEETEPPDQADVDAFEADEIVFESPAVDAPVDVPLDVPVDRGAGAVLPLRPPHPPAPVAPVAPETRPAPVGPPPPPVGSLAIPDYDNLSASQVIPRLAGLTEDELEAVRRYELAERGRKTILGKIAQLQSA